MTIIAMVAIAALLGGGASFAASDALPGQVLYPVKVNVNERIGAAFHLSGEAAASYEAELAERRLREAAELAAESAVDAEAKVELEERFGAHAERVSSRIEALESRGNVMTAAELASRFETSLRAHQQVLAELHTKDEDVRELEASVQTALSKAASVRGRLEARIASGEESKIEVEAAAEGKVNAALNVVAEAKRYLENKKEKLGAQAVVNAEARIKAAERLVLDAQAKLEAEAYAEAFGLGSQAIRTAQEAKTLVEVMVETHVGTEVNIGGAVKSRMDVEGDTSVNGNVNADVNVNTRGGINLGL